MNFALDKKYFKIAFYSIILIEFFSLYAFAFPLLNKIFFILILLGVLFLAWRNLFYGVLIILSELIIASKGYLFYFEAGEKAISIRIGLFAVVMSVFAFKVFLKYFKTKKLEIAFLKSKLFPYFLILFLFIIYGVISGIMHKNQLSNVFFDSNGWLYFLLAFPIFEVIRKDNFNKLFSVLLAALTALILKTFFLLFIFSHNFIGITPEIYRWVRITGVGEIAKMETGFFRIFLQSHIYAVLTFFILLPILNKKFVQRWGCHQAPISSKFPYFSKFLSKIFGLCGCISKKFDKEISLKSENLSQNRCFATAPESIKSNKLFLSLIIFLASVIIISFSRSFAVGIIATFFVYYIYHLVFKKEKIKSIFVSFLVVLVIFVSAIGLSGFLIEAPIPFRERSDIDFISSLSKRATEDDVAIGSRWGLLKPLWKEVKENSILGAGFGKTVTYKTEDPRALENNPNGLYTTYAFEWGYLDIWLKLGLFGLLAYLLLLFQIIKQGHQKQQNKIILGSILGVIALTAIHFFTPYLNHPLGIGYLLLWSAVYGEE